jgi:hypothetical protein
MSDQHSSNIELDKFHEIEIQQVFEAIVNVQNSRIQTGIFFGTLNLGAIGIAFTLQKAGIILLSSLLLIGFIVVDIRGRSALAGLYYRALQLQKLFAPNEPDTFLSIIMLGFLDKQIKLIEQIQDRNSRLKALRTLPIRSPGLVSFWLPLLAFIIEVILGFYLWYSNIWAVI